MAYRDLLPCPRCRREMPVPSRSGRVDGACRSCTTEYTFIPFPALSTAAAVVRAQSVGEEASCFFHGENQAESVCEGCGRFLCAVCAVDFSGRRLCPSCIAGQKNTAAAVVKDRVLYDGIALMLVLLPMLIWPVTLLTAPLAVGMVVYGWRKPGSLVRGRRWRLGVALGLAILQILGWVGIAIGVWLG